MAQDRVLFTQEYKKDRNSDTFKKMVYDLCYIVCNKAPIWLREEFIGHVYIKILEKWDTIQPDAGRGDVWSYFYQYIYNQFRTAYKYFFNRTRYEIRVEEDYDKEMPESITPARTIYEEEKEYLEELRDEDDYLYNTLIQIMLEHHFTYSHSIAVFKYVLRVEYNIECSEENIISKLVKICWNIYMMGSRNKYLINFLLAKITLAEICSIWKENCRDILKNDSEDSQWRIT